jgi:hypothetical protein
MAFGENFPYTPIVLLLALLSVWSNYPSGVMTIFSKRFALAHLQA